MVMTAFGMAIVTPLIVVGLVAVILIRLSVIITLTLIMVMLTTSLITINVAKSKDCYTLLYIKNTPFVKNLLKGVSSITL